MYDVIDHFFKLKIMHYNYCISDYPLENNDVTTRRNTIMLLLHYLIQPHTAPSSNNTSTSPLFTLSIAGPPSLSLLNSSSNDCASILCTFSLDEVAVEDFLTLYMSTV